MSEQQVKIPVLIVGGGPVGLSTALFSGRRGVRTMLLEKRDSTSMLPRAPGLQARTMELFRAAGLGKEIRALEKGNSHAYFEGGIIKVDTFSDIDNAELLEAPSLDGPTVSPERVMGCGQDRYEKVLVAKAREYGADVRFNTRLLSFEADDEGVTAIAEEASTGKRLTIRADYLVGADGAGSRIRQALGVERVGRGTVFNALSIYFRAPELETLLKDRKFILCYASAGGSLMGLSRLHGCDPWLAAPIYFPEKGEKPEDFTDDRCVEIVRQAAGKDIDVEIMDKVPWQGAQLVSETFRVNRVFLAGDAAHVHPPAGGFGANTGIHDAHNLSWKLAAVLHGWGTDELLDTYDAERRPLGTAMSEQALVRNRIRHGYATEQDRQDFVDDVIITLGYRYRSSSIVGAPQSKVLTPDLELTGEPGTRAPHVWLTRQRGDTEETISAIDLFWDDFVLLHGPEGGGWAKAAVKAAEKLGVPLVTHAVGPDEELRPTERDWAEVYGVGPQGAVLVRPDAFVSWRSEGGAADPDTLLESVLARASAISPAAITPAGDSAS
ncbi:MULTISPECIES: FAD-dependent monooxygenase [unclassified Streptomyces]|uniref:FAD-dependent monooxygenase n=1 Tax=unclassified Streptomyces TaxID=2593676 RepID=UPI002DD89A88|nr:MULTISPECIES: FAD-dependent monooxygenase [unclassified Streptomyces]WSA95519.1 FAD-dependent monooxygenase [Streptomyces sp. NBC_01795]WSB79933.1 FAD-dependent monooxygenase [Streptomyces sp. NBC_01775]WSS11859.1 FAD-dependent monooxygenase [Streptomyces sp. NBC_01186]WSS40574.1 FAD-dependent monooxygenase [Streptomyces sp. NBC_01187]